MEVIKNIPNISEGTLIKTISGYVPVEDIDDSTILSDGSKFYNVTSKLVTTKTMVLLKTTSGRVLKSSPDLKIASDGFSWKEVGSLKHFDSIFIPVPNPVSQITSPKFMLCGAVYTLKTLGVEPTIDNIKSLFSNSCTNWEFPIDSIESACDYATNLVSVLDQFSQSFIYGCLLVSNPSISIDKFLVTIRFNQPQNMRFLSRAFYQFGVIANVVDEMTIQLFYTKHLHNFFLNYSIYKRFGVVNSYYSVSNYSDFIPKTYYRDIVKSVEIVKSVKGYHLDIVGSNTFVADSFICCTE